MKVGRNLLNTAQRIAPASTKEKCYILELVFNEHSFHVIFSKNFVGKIN